jgi:hypothetical protein
LSHVVVAVVTHVTRGDELCHATKIVGQKLSATMAGGLVLVARLERATY